MGGEKELPDASLDKPARSRAMVVFGRAVLVVTMALVILGATIVHGRRHLDNQAGEILARLKSTAAIKVTLVAKRESMRTLHSNTLTAEAYLVPQRDDAKLSFQGILIQHDQGTNTTQSFVWHDHRAYWSITTGMSKGYNGSAVPIASGCVAPTQVPSLHLLHRSLVSATVVDGVDSIDSTPSLGDECDTLLHVTFMNEPFVVCTSADHEVKLIHGDDVDVHVEYLADAGDVPAITVPADTTTGQPLVCSPLPPSEDAPDQVTWTSWQNLATASRFGLHKLAGIAPPRRLAAMFGSKCGCKLKAKKPCMFLHGLGSPVSQGQLDNHPGYWGKIKDHAPCCSSIKFAKMDTVNRGWDDRGMHAEFCKHALSISKSRSNAIGDIILVTHSMGNLIAGSAVASGVCSMSSGVTWISLAGPMAGSKSANLLENICTRKSPVPKELGQLAKMCPIKPAFLSLKHQKTVQGGMQQKYKAAQAVARRHVTKTLCATDPAGLAKSVMVVALPIVAKFSKHDSRANDGVVDLPSCTAGVGGSGFGGSVKSHNYRASINHIDAAFKHGDGWISADRKPVKWFECAL